MDYCSLCKIPNLGYENRAKREFSVEIYAVLCKYTVIGKQNHLLK
jgi:hypothetical protein